MKRFRDILVGVDLASGDRFVCDELPPTTQEAVERALWLAKLNSARLLFQYSLDMSAQARHLIQETQGSEPTVVNKAEAVLERLVERTRRDGIAANYRVDFGKSWVEVIRQVLRGKHDLVIIGTRHRGRAKSFLMGSTGIKLLRKCPCPVWVTQPQPERRFASILVAHDLSPVGDLAMQLGCSMAQLLDGQLHVLHAAEYAELEHMLPARVSAEQAESYRRNAEQHIRAQLGDIDSARVHLVTDRPEFAILEHIKRYHVKLLVMGTVARSGIPGLITGNTAEQLLPQIPCSVLAVKPTGFESPVTLDE